MKSKKLNLALCVLTLWTAGCATITSSDSENLRIEAVAADGKELKDVDCMLSNDRGSWTVKAPGSVLVRKSAGDMKVSCTKKGYPKGTATLVSSAHAGMAGNILFGGVVGAAIDHGKGTAYKYPPKTVIKMGSDQKITR